MGCLLFSSLLLLSCFHMPLSLASQDPRLVLIAPSSDAFASSSPEFFLSGKSRDFVSRAGASADLTCRTNAPWQLCSWRTPQGQWCDRLSTDRYRGAACHHSERIKFEPMIDTWYDPSVDCSISLLDLRPEDSGVWRCLVKQEARDASSWSEGIYVTVVSPFALSANPIQPAIVRQNSNESDPEVICTATGAAGGVDPVLTWVMGGKEVLPTENKTHSWQEDHSDGSRIIYLSLMLSSEDKALVDGTRLRCLSKQLFPNGTVIFESSVAATLSVQEADVDASHEELEQQSGIGGLVFAIIVVVVILIILALLCYAQKYKKWCYSKPPKVRADGARQLHREHDQLEAFPREATGLMVVEIRAQGEISNGEVQSSEVVGNNEEDYSSTTAIDRVEETEAAGTEVAVASENLQARREADNFQAMHEADDLPAKQEADDLQVTQEADDPQARQGADDCPPGSGGIYTATGERRPRSSLPPLYLPLSNSIGQSEDVSSSDDPPPSAPPVEAQQGQASFNLSAASPTRLMQLISAPPPTPSNTEPNARVPNLSSTPIISRPLSMPIFKAQGLLSEGLTSRRPPNLRRSNEYVKIKPKSMEVITFEGEDEFEEEIVPRVADEERQFAVEIHRFADEDDDEVTDRRGYGSEDRFQRTTAAETAL